MIVATQHAVPLALLFLAGFCVGYNAAVTGLPGSRRR